MERTKLSVLAAFRHKLWLENINVLAESEQFGMPYFILEEDMISSFAVANLFRICPFGIISLYFEGKKHLALTLAFDD